MLSWIRLSHVAEWIGAPIENSAAAISVTAIGTDTRSLVPGQVFLALRGENFDGNLFIDEAVKRGAVAVISENAVSVSVPVLVVPNTLTALVQIAEQIRRHFSGPVVGITGSAGKSSTKDMTAVLLGPETVSSPASFNNLMGVSRALYLVTDRTRNLVLEMGMNAFGEIAELCRHFRPQAAAITNIGDAHIGKLGGKRGIYRAKKELFDYLAGAAEIPLGVALNIDDPLVVEAYGEAFPNGVRTVKYSATGAPADVRILRQGIDPDSGYLSLTLEVKGEKRDFRFAIFGQHHAQNICAAVSLASLLGVGFAEMQKRFDQIRPASHRGEIHSLAEGRILIDESYNSNPSALSSSLASLSELDPSRRRVLILGEMLELGEFSEKLHSEVGEKLAARHAQRSFPLLLVGVGSHVTPLVDAVRTKTPSARCLSAKSADEVFGLLSPLLLPKDIVFIKGSRGIKLDKVVKILLEETRH